MAITLNRPIEGRTHIEAKIMLLANQANVLMGQISQAKAWCDDVLTDEHHAAGLLLDDGGQPMSLAQLSLYRTTFAALDALRAGANAPRPNGQPSVGALMRPYL